MGGEGGLETVVDLRHYLGFVPSLGDPPVEGLDREAAAPQVRGQPGHVEHLGWSVVVTGTAHLVRDTAEVGATSGRCAHE